MSWEDILKRNKGGRGRTRKKGKARKKEKGRDGKEMPVIIRFVLATKVAFCICFRCISPMP